jgi:triacylglycerol lipase
VSTLVEFPVETYRETAFGDFNPDTADFTIGNARALMWASQLAYENATTIEAVRQLWRFTSVEPFVKRKIGITGSFETRGIIGERSNAVVLAFGGTDPAVWQTLATDLNFRPAASDTHSGFQMAADGVRDDIDRAIEQSRQAGKPLFVTGHSLGGALAALAAQRADAAGATPKAVYVFGMPRVGREQFRAAYDGRLGQATYRLVHGFDIVARVPMSGIGFRHVGRSLQCKSGGKFDLATPLSALGADQPAFARGLVDDLVNGIGNVATGRIFSPAGLGTFGPLFKFLPPPIRDHLQDRYLTALGENLTPP